MGTNNILPTDAYSDEIQEIIGRKPTWILRCGISVIFSIIVLVVVACYFIKYPQTVTGYVYLSSNNPPSDLVAKNAGILDSLFVDDGDTVRSGQLIALIANAANYYDIVKAENFLSYGIDSIFTISPPDDVRTLKLGDINQGWTDFISLCSDYFDYLNIDQVGKKKKLLYNQVSLANDYYKKLEKQRHTYLENLEYEEITRRRDSILLSQKVISQSEYDNSLKNFVSRKNSLAGFDASMASANLDRLQLEQQIQELETKEKIDIAQYKRRLEQAYNQLVNYIGQWKEQYAIIAPFDGIVSFQNFWSSGQHVNAGNVIASVCPAGQNIIIGKLKVSSVGFGKVETGQDVIIKLNGFPYLEFGILHGTVQSISSVPETSDNGLVYNIDVALPSGLQSSYIHTFPFVQNMDGTAEIITEDMRLIEQFIRPIISLFKNR